MTRARGTSRRLEEYYIELGEAEVTWLRGNSVPLAPNPHTGDLVAHYDDVKVFRWVPRRDHEGDGASRVVTSAFLKRFSFSGVYGLVDPLIDSIFYVGRSANIGKRFQQHLLPERSVRRCISLRYEKERWIYGIRESGQKPGLVVLSLLNTAEEELLWIYRLKPDFNTHGIDKPKPTPAPKPNKKRNPRQSYAMNRARTKGASEKYVRSLGKH